MLTKSVTASESPQERGLFQISKFVLQDSRVVDDLAIHNRQD